MSQRNTRKTTPLWTDLSILSQFFSGIESQDNATQLEKGNIVLAGARRFPA
jgi:hypothetical protein